MTTLTTVQIKALVFNSVGRGAESNNYSPYQIRWAGTRSSGLSIGYMQWDFGGRLSASDTANLLARYNTWASSTATPQFSSEAALKQFLGQTDVKAKAAQNSAEGLNLRKLCITPRRV